MILENSEFVKLIHKLALPSVFVFFFFKPLGRKVYFVRFISITVTWSSALQSIWTLSKLSFSNENI